MLRRYPVKTSNALLICQVPSFIICRGWAENTGSKKTIINGCVLLQIHVLYGVFQSARQQTLQIMCDIIVTGTIQVHFHPFIIKQ